MDVDKKKRLVDYLSQYTTQNKRDKINNLIVDRTRYVTVVMEDVFQPHNASAVVRSTECFGMQDIHIIEKRNIFSPNNSIAKGSAKWMNFYKYKDTTSCFKALKDKGYKIVATTPHERSFLVHQLPIQDKIALVFGTESTGLTQEAMELADEYVTIPMYGFTESFNVSVSVSICLYDITQRLRASHIDWQLTEEQKIDIQLDWLRNIVEGAFLLEKRLFKQD